MMQITRITKKFGLMLGLVGLVVMSLPQTALAGSCPSTVEGTLGFPTWYRGLNCDGSSINLDNQEIGPVIAIVGLNVLDMMIRAVGIVAVAFVIYGGFLYMTAHGEPGRIANGKQAITRALTGLIIAIMASSLVAFLVSQLNKG